MEMLIMIHTTPFLNRSPSLPAYQPKSYSRNQSNVITWDGNRYACKSHELVETDGHGNACRSGSTHHSGLSSYFFWSMYIHFTGFLCIKVVVLPWFFILGLGLWVHTSIDKPTATMSYRNNIVLAWRKEDSQMNPKVSSSGYLIPTNPTDNNRT